VTIRVALAAVLALCAAAPAGAAPEALRGEQIYTRCLACHALAYDRVGPRHCGLFGRMAGSVAGFEYSAAMKDSKFSWDEKTLERFLAKPLAMVPGSTMTYDGVPTLKERMDLITYLKRAQQAPDCAK
jgi:cytochrome c